MTFSAIRFTESTIFVKRSVRAQILVPVVVRKEILGPNVPPDEERLLTGFSSGCQIVALGKPTRFAQALSYADNCILTLAVKEQATGYYPMIVCSERPL